MIDINKWKIPVDEKGKEKNKWIDKICKSPYHQPPGHLYIPPGIEHIHTCPNCGKETTMIGSGVTY